MTRLGLAYLLSTLELGVLVALPALRSVRARAILDRTAEEMLGRLAASVPRLDRFELDVATTATVSALRERFPSLHIRVRGAGDRD